MGRSAKHLYHLLQLPDDAGVDDLKVAHRKLVKQWHPDQFKEGKERDRAEKKLSEINSAYSQLLRLNKLQKRIKKERSSQQIRYNYQKSASENPQTQKSANRKSSGSRNKKKTNTQSSNTFRQSWFEKFLSRLNNRYQKAHLHRRRKKRAHLFKKEVARNEKRWIKQREDFDKNTRIGLYKSFINSVIFGRLELFMDNESDITSLGSFSMRDKYELELRHSLIQDKIFYAVNGGFNLLLKYIFGFVIFFQFIVNIMTYFFYGSLAGDLHSFIYIQVFTIGLFGLLVLPDNFYQRYLLWKHRHLSLPEIDETFEQQRLPHPWNYVKYGLLSSKYVLLTFLII